MRSMFEKYGGFGTVSKRVMDFYGRVLDSDTAGEYFEGIDLPSLIDHQTKFLSQVMGGPVAYSNEMLQRVHAAHRIDREAFDEVASLLAATLADHGVEPDDVAFIREEIEARSHYIISPGSN